MDRVHLTLTDEKLKPLQYRKIVLDGNDTAKLMCPNGHDANLDHTVSANGEVNPSVVCPYDCDWHVWAILDDWNANATG